MRSPSVDVMSTEVLDSQQRGSVATTSPAERHSTPVDGVDVLGALSPSRAGDFMTCPLLYRFRTIDKLPEPASPDAVRGTLVHKVLEDLFDLPAVERTPVRAEQMLEPSWHRLLEDEPGLGEIFDGEGAVDRDRWWDTCRTVLERYFTLEDPTRLEPAERELYVEWLLDSKLLLRGFVDRVVIRAHLYIRHGRDIARVPAMRTPHAALFDQLAGFVHGRCAAPYMDKWSMRAHDCLSGCGIFETMRFEKG